MTVVLEIASSLTFLAMTEEAYFLPRSTFSTRPVYSLSTLSWIYFISFSERWRNLPCGFRYSSTGLRFATFTFSLYLPSSIS